MTARQAFAVKKSFLSLLYALQTLTCLLIAHFLYGDTPYDGNQPLFRAIKTGWRQHIRKGME
jgi:hypothetical protein